MYLALKRIQHFSYALRSPINIDLLKSQTGRKEIKKRLQTRFKPKTILGEAIDSYENFRKGLYEFEKMSQQSNQIKKKIKIAMKGGQTSQQTEQLKQDLLKVKEGLNAQEAQLKVAKTQTENYLQKLGNDVHSQTPISQNEENSRVLRYFHPNITQTIAIEQIVDHQAYTRQHFKNKPASKSYQELTKEFGIADLTRGQKVSGHRGYFLCSNGVKLALALAQYGLEFLQSKGYQLYQTPAFILESVLKDSCQLQTIETDLYRFPQDDLCLIATSQQTLAGYYKGQVFEPQQMPKLMAGYSSCFRREAGAHGKDIHGLFRLHQFEKVEQFVVCRPDESQGYMQKMIQNAQQFYQSLQIPYRLVDIVSGELNDAAYRKIDLQAWYPGQQRFRQLVSVSNCTDYQSRMLQTRYREGQSVKYPHMLNGTLIAVQRAMTCLLEHFYSAEDNLLKIPKALQPYIRCTTLKPQ